MKRAIVVAALCVLLATPAWGGFDEGMAAYMHRDYTSALREWRPLAERGYADAQLQLGLLYLMGLGVNQDSTKGVRWCRNAAEQGHVDAEGQLAFQYEAGMGVPKDDIQAYKWYDIAAALEDRKPGDPSWSTNRDILARNMTPGQIAEAQRLAREWRAAFEKRKAGN